MPRRSHRAPAYRLHKSSGQARVIIDGQHNYLGRYDSPESHEKYHRLVAEWLAARKKPNSVASTGTAAPPTLSNNELILAFWRHAKQRYVKNGVSTSEIRSFRTALLPVRQLRPRATTNG